MSAVSSVKKAVVQEVKASDQLLQQPQTSKNVHEIRKHLKRARAGIRLLRSSLGRDNYKKENRLFRDVGRAFASLRDQRVKEATLKKVFRIQPHRRRSSISPLPQAKIQQLKAKLRQANQLIENKKEKKEEWERRLKQSYKKSEKAFLKAASTGSDLDFHEFRKQLKYLRYQLEIFEKSSPRLKKMVNRLDKYSEVLGKEHDLFVLKPALKSLIAEKERARISAALESKKDKLRITILSQGVTFFSEPKDFLKLKKKAPRN